MPKQTKSGAIELRGDGAHETIWATQAEIAAIFGVERSVITKHLKNIYKDEELSKKATCAKNAQVQKEGNRTVTRQIEYYNLDAIISVGYRVNSKTATQFRQWATKTLKQHITKGYTINKKVIAQHYSAFLQSVADIEALLPEHTTLDSKTVLDLVHLPLCGFSKKPVSVDGIKSIRLRSLRSHSSLQRVTQRKKNR